MPQRKKLDLGDINQTHQTNVNHPSRTSTTQKTITSHHSSMDSSFNEINGCLWWTLPCRLRILLDVEDPPPMQIDPPTHLYSSRFVYPSLEFTMMQRLIRFPSFPLRISRLNPRDNLPTTGLNRRSLHLAPPFLLDDYTPRYQLLSSIDASKKRSAAYAHLSKCNLCPRLCNVNRYEKTGGACLIGAETVKVNVIAPHFGEGK